MAIPHDCISHHDNNVAAPGSLLQNPIHIPVNQHAELATFSNSLQTPRSVQSLSLQQDDQVIQQLIASLAASQELVRHVVAQRQTPLFSTTDHNDHLCFSLPKQQSCTPANYGDLLTSSACHAQPELVLNSSFTGVSRQYNYMDASSKFNLFDIHTNRVFDNYQMSIGGAVSPEMSIEELLNLSAGVSSTNSLKQQQPILHHQSIIENDRRTVDQSTNLNVFQPTSCHHETKCLNCSSLESLPSIQKCDGAQSSNTVTSHSQYMPSKQDALSSSSLSSPWSDSTLHHGLPSILSPCRSSNIQTTISPRQSGPTVPDDHANSHYSLSYAQVDVNNVTALSQMLTAEQIAIQQQELDMVRAKQRESKRRHKEKKKMKLALAQMAGAFTKSPETPNSTASTPTDLTPRLLTESPTQIATNANLCSSAEKVTRFWQLYDLCQTMQANLLVAVQELNKQRADPIVAADIERQESLQLRDQVSKQLDTKAIQRQNSCSVTSYSYPQASNGHH